jgi:hypothetical protein
MTCGENGGTNGQGKPCGHEAGWGTEHSGEGPCKQHDEEACANLRTQKTTYLKVLAEKGLHVEAAREVGVDQGTAWRWRQADAEFAAQVSTAEIDGLRNTLDEYDKSVRTRVIAGNASSAVEIWWATNQAIRERKLRGTAQRYVNVQKVEHSTDPARPLKVETDMGALTDAELKTLVKLLERAQV